MAALDFNSLEFASAVLRRVLENKYDNVHVVATCAPGHDCSKEDAEYYRYIAFTQRVVKDLGLVCYVTYRTKRPSRMDPLGPAFSSIEIFDPTYSRAKTFKFKLEDYDTAEDAFKAALECVVTKIKER